MSEARSMDRARRGRLVDAIGVVHIEPPPNIGLATLCGLRGFEEPPAAPSDRAPSCAACMAVWHFVRNGVLR